MENELIAWFQRHLHDDHGVVYVWRSDLAWLRLIHREHHFAAVTGSGALRAQHREQGYPWRCNCRLTNNPHKEPATGTRPHLWMDADNEAIELRRMEP